MQRTAEFLENFRSYQDQELATPRAVRPIRALAIDGGGVRGLIPARVLAEIERRCDRPIWQCFDLISGTSTGGILTLALTAPAQGGGAQWSAAQLVDLYRHSGQTIFKRSKLGIPGRQLLLDKYSPSELERQLRSRLGDTRLSQALTKVIITAWNLSHNVPAYFNSAEAGPVFSDPLMRDVARATSAAPSYFRPCWMAEPDQPALAFIDGGVFANNPAKVAYLALQPPAAAAATAAPATGAPATGAPATGAPSELVMLSLGTGSGPPLNPNRQRFWGLLPWAAPLVHLLLSAPSELVDVELSQVRGGLTYHRWEPEPGAYTDRLDDASSRNIEALDAAGTAVLLRHDKELDKLCKVICPDSG